METNFFKNLESFSEGVQWQLTIYIDNGNFIVSTFIKPNQSISLPAMLFKGTASEFDAEFFNQLSIPVQLTKELFANNKEYLLSVETARKAISEKSKGKGNGDEPKVKVTPVDDSADKKRRYDEAMKSIEDLNAHCKYTDALAILPNKEDYPEKKAELEKLAKELQWKCNQLSLL